jgi:hypothetical protein
MTNSTSGEGTAYPSGLHEFTPINLFGEEDFERFPIIQQIRSHGSHLVYRARSPDTVLKKRSPKEDHIQQLLGFQHYLNFLTSDLSSILKLQLD